MLSGFGKCEHSHQPMMPSTNKRLRRAARTRYGWLIHFRCLHVGRAASKGFVVPKVDWDSVWEQGTSFWTAILTTATGATHTTIT